MPSNDEILKNLNKAVIKLVKGLKEYRHTILNATPGIQRSVREIHYKFEYMSEATDIFNKVLEDVREIIEGKADEK